MPMGEFDNMETMMLTKDLLDQYPVWKWNDSTDARIPVLDFDPLPEDEPTLFLKARFKAPGGEEFDGYLAGRETFYAFAVFIGEADFGFNFNLEEMFKDEVDQLCRVLGKPEQWSLFPLHYETDVHFKDRPDINGFLLWPEGWN